MTSRSWFISTIDRDVIPLSIHPPCLIASIQETSSLLGIFLDGMQWMTESEVDQASPTWTHSLWTRTARQMISMSERGSGVL